MTTHTPAPWKASTHGVGSNYSQVEVWGGNHGVAIVLNENPNQSADTQLIAAAPELLEAVEWMIPTFEEMESMDVLNEAQRTALEIARAAIAKAKGE